MFVETESPALSRRMVEHGTYLVAYLIPTSSKGGKGLEWGKTKGRQAVGVRRSFE